MERNNVITITNIPKQSFWERAPVQNLLTSIPRAIPFVKSFFPNTKPSLIENSHMLYPEYTFEKDFEYKKSYICLRRIKASNVHEYNSFLQKHFYPHSLGYIRSYRSYYFHDEMAKGLLYGLELRFKKTNALIGLILSKCIGKMDSHPVALVTELCVHIEHRKSSLANILLEGLYSCSVFDKSIKIHFFQVDSIYLAPANVPALNSSTVYGRKQLIQKQLIRGEHLSKELLQQIQSKLLINDSDAIMIQPENVHMNSNIIVYAKEFSFLVLRILPELDSNNKEGAEVLYYMGASDEIDDILDSTPYGWFESSNKISDLWTVKGNTITYAFHLNYGCPSRRNLYYF